MLNIFLTALVLLPLMQSNPMVFTGRVIDHPGKVKLLYPVQYDANQTQAYFMGDKLFFVEPGVITPSIASAFLWENIEIKAGESVLDMGCGNGVQGVFAAVAGASNVVAIDISREAVVNTQHNAEYHHVEKIVDARVGDLFSPLKASEKFDVVIFNVKYPGFGTGENAVNLHERFFKDLDRWLKPNGRLYYHVGLIERIPEISALLKRYGYRIMRMNMLNAVKFEREPIIYTVQRISDTNPPSALPAVSNSPPGN